MVLSPTYLDDIAGLPSVLGSGALVSDRRPLQCLFTGSHSRTAGNRAFWRSWAHSTASSRSKSCTLDLGRVQSVSVSEGQVLRAVEEGLRA